MEIAQGIEGIRAAARGVGARLPERPRPDASHLLPPGALDLLPAGAPDDLRELFARCDLEGGLPVEISPSLLDSRSAHRLWSGELARMPNAVPRCLFPIAHDRMSFLFVELGGPYARTEQVGAVWSWAFGAQWFDLFAPSIAEWLGLLARAVTTGAYAAHEDPRVPGRSRIAVPRDAVAALAATRLRRTRTSSGAGARISARAHLWPDRWLAASGVTPEMRRSDGGALAIAELIERAAARPLAATITGEVADLVGQDDGVYALTVDDHHELWVYCPSSVSVLGPRLRRPFEFDVTAGPWPGDERRRRLLDPGWLGAALVRAMQSGPRVVAQAVRPVSS